MLTDGWDMLSHLLNSSEFAIRKTLIIHKIEYEIGLKNLLAAGKSL